MRHYFSCILLISAALVLCACSDSNTQQSATAVTGDLTANQEENEGGDSDSAEEEPASEEEYAEGTQDLSVHGTEVSTQFYTLYLPEEWEGNVTYRYFQFPQDAIYRLDIYENSSAAATEGVGGRAASLLLTRSYGEETGLKSTEYLGLLKEDDGSFYYVLLDYPTQDQFTDATADAYDKIRSGMGQIKEWIEGKEGYTFEAGEPPKDEEEEKSED